jgi:hypothetical protein
MIASPFIAAAVGVDAAMTRKHDGGRRRLIRKAWAM